MRQFMDIDMLYCLLILFRPLIPAEKLNKWFADNCHIYVHEYEYEYGQ